MTSRSSGFNRNGFFGFGARLGGLSVVAVLALAPVTTPAYADCFGDLTGPDETPDGTVGTEDLQAVISSWGHYQSAADLDGDISTPVGIHDLLLLLEAWGDCPSPCDQDPCQEGCTYDVCDVNGPCYDYSACLDIRCAENDCYSEDCPDYCYSYDCFADPCDWSGPCYDWIECFNMRCAAEPCYSEDCPGYDDCGCGPFDPCCLYDPCDPNCPDYNPCEPWCCYPECPYYPDCW